MTRHVITAGLRSRTYRRLRVTVTLCMLVGGVVLLGAVPAWGLGQRGHVFGFSFGSEGEGAGKFRFGGGALMHGEVVGVAVSEATGDVYVVDRGNDRVEQFRPRLGVAGELVGEEFVAAWGWGVSDGKSEYEVCISGCRAGVGGVGKGELEEAGAIAVDNTVGGAETVFVGADGSARRPDVQRFLADGERALGKLPVEEEGVVDGVATDLQGRVWLYRSEEEGTGVVEGFRDASPPVLVEPVLESVIACAKQGFGVDGAGEEFYVDHELLTGEEECPAVVEREKAEEKEPAEGVYARSVVAAKVIAAELLGGVTEPLVGELDPQGTSAVAVDQASSETSPLGGAAAGDVYVENGESIAVFDDSGGLVQTLGTGELQDGMGVAVDSRTGDVFAVDGASDTVDVFVPEAAGRPVVEDLSAQSITPSEVQLSAQVDPDGSDTHYYFQYGTVDCASEPAECTDVPAAPGSDLGSGFGGRSLSVTLQGLKPGSSYFYRVLASNGVGEAEGEQSVETFQTLPGSRGLLADGRAWELVSPAEQGGASIEPLSKEGGLIEASQNGEAIGYVANGPVVAEPGGNRALEPTQVLSTRTSEGWGVEDLVTPHERGEGLKIGEAAEYRAFSEDLALGLVQTPAASAAEPLEAPPLAPDASEKTLYVRDDPSLSPEPGEATAYQAARANQGFLAPGYAPLVTPAQVTSETQPGEKTRFGGRLTFVDGTPDLAHVVFEAGVSLLSGSAAGLYESDTGGGFQLVSVLPNGQAAGGGEVGEEPVLGDESTNVRGAISNDGSRVIFSGAGIEEPYEIAEYHRLYLHDTQTGQTLQLNAAQGGVGEPVGEESEVGFQAATPDGSRVFFTDTAPLTAESQQRPVFGANDNPADLYECEIIETAGKLSCQLKDLTPNPAGGSADVLNVVAGIGETGEQVYFVANGVLAPGAKPGDCTHIAQETPPAGATCNLYLWQNGAIGFIASLSNEDSGDWGSLKGSGKEGSHVEPRPDLADLTARVSPNGEYLAFMSQQPLTGSDNKDANDPGVRDQEVYLYQASTRQLTCVSCNPGGPSSGVLDTPFTSEGLGLVVDRRGDWLGQYLAGSIPGWTPLGLDTATHQPRYLSNSGRLFFNSPDQLVPQAANAKEDVYEYEPSDVGSCTQTEGCVSLISSGSAQQESAFVEASENGDSAFFLTAQPLVAADHDTNYDLYDARVCTSTSPCLTSEASSLRPCETTRSCKPGSTQPPTIQTPPTAAPAAGLATPQALTPTPTSAPRSRPKPLTRAQQLAKALRACRKTKSKHRRQACERSARKHFGPKRKAKSNAHRARHVEGRRG
jgi:DNA-binding beta-propeller fold protein YncE